MSLHLATDKQLIDSYLSGSHASFKILVNRYKSRVYSYIHLVAYDKNLVEDIFQDTFIKVVNYLRSDIYIDNGKFLSWVLCIAHNMALDYYRKSKSMPPVFRNKEEGDIFDNLHVQEHTVEDKIVIDQFRKHVEILLEYLPPEQKEVMVLRHYHGMSYREIAERIDTNSSTARGYMRKALIRIREVNKQKQLIMSPKIEGY